MNKNNKYKNSEIGSIPENWDVIRLKDILKEVNIKVRDVDLSQDEIPILSIGRYEGLVLQSQKFGKRIASRNINTYKIIEKGQFAMGFPMDEGVIFLLKDFRLGAISPAYLVWEIISDKFYPEFLNRILKSDRMINIYKSLYSTTVHRRRIVGKSDFLSISIPLPPLPEQKKIVEILSTVQEAIEKTDAVIKAAKKLKKSLLKYLFTYGPVPVHEADKVKLIEIDNGFEPSEWIEYSINDLFDSNWIYLRSGFPWGQWNSDNKGIPQLRPFNIDNDGRINLEQIKYIGTDLDEFSDFIVSGDIIFNNTNSEELVGKTAYWGDNYVLKCVLSNHMTCIRIFNENKLDGRCVAYYFYKKWLEGYFKSICRRHVNQASISLSKLKEITMFLPEINLQKNIANFLNEIDNKIQTEQIHRQALEKLFDSLLARLMSGEIRIN